MTTILEFQGEYRWLSNFVPNARGFSVEHHFQAAKTTDPDWRERILHARTPGVAKRLGRQCPLRPEWNSGVAEAVMRDLLYRKFSEPVFRQMLLETGNAALEEGNTWNDRFWGICPPGSG